MRLRVQHRGGQCVVTVGDDARLADLRAAVEAAVGIPGPAQHLRVGFPPKEVPRHPHALLRDLGIANGDTLRVEEGPIDAPDAPLTTSVEGNGGAATSGPAPPPLPPPAPLTGRPSPLDPTVFADGARVVKRTIPADNSCLFNAVQYVCEGNPSRNGARHLRHLVADIIARDPETYTAAHLDKLPAEYCSWILKSDSWGGAIELAILSAHLETQIRCLDVQTTTMHAFGEDQGYPRCVYLVYDGIHYDALALEACPGAPEEADLTVFAPEDAGVQDGAVRLVGDLHRERKFTDVGNFTLRCGVCQTGIKGQREAQAHAQATGHTNFAEY